jgi:hypothetical protein
MSGFFPVVIWCIFSAHFPGTEQLTPELVRDSCLLFPSVSGYTELPWEDSEARESSGCRTESSPRPDHPAGTFPSSVVEHLAINYCYSRGVVAEYYSRLSDVIPPLRI